MYPSRDPRPPDYLPFEQVDSGSSLGMTRLDHFPTPSKGSVGSLITPNSLHCNTSYMCSNSVVMARVRLMSSVWAPNSRTAVANPPSRYASTGSESHSPSSDRNSLMASPSLETVVQATPYWPFSAACSPGLGKRIPPSSPASMFSSMEAYT